MNYLDFAKAFANLDFNLEDLFLWITRVFTALSKVLMAFFMASIASIFLPARMSFLTALTEDLKFSLVCAFLALRLRDWCIALMADFVLGIELVDSA